MSVRDPNYAPVGEPGDTPREKAMLTQCAYCQNDFGATCDGHHANGVPCNLRLCQRHAATVGNRHYCRDHAQPVNA